MLKAPEAAGLWVEQRPGCSASRGRASVIAPISATLEGHGVRLEPLAPAHEHDLTAAAADGRLWELWFTSVPSPDLVGRYIAQALAGRDDGHMLPWAVRELATGTIVGSTRYHDIVPAIDRVEIGYTWYAASWQRTHVNTACKLLLLSHAFEALGCQVVGLRTDNFNFAPRPRRRHPPSPGPPGRDGPGFGDVQHPAARVAGREAPSRHPALPSPGLGGSGRSCRAAILTHGRPRTRRSDSTASSGSSPPGTRPSSVRCARRSAGGFPRPSSWRTTTTISS